MKDLIIAPAEKKDWPQLLALWRAEYHFHHSLDNIYYVPPSPAVDKKFKAHTAKILVAKIKDQLVGFVTYAVGQADYFDTKIKRFGEIEEIFIQLEFRGQGIGAQLLAAAESQLKKSGVKHLKLQVSTFNSKALKFYQRLGYLSRQILLFKSVK